MAIVPLQMKMVYRIGVASRYVEQMGVKLVGRPVKAALKASKLSGSPRCVFEVTLAYGRRPGAARRSRCGIGSASALDRTERSRAARVKPLPESRK
jgi:hypothetical protein